MSRTQGLCQVKEMERNRFCVWMKTRTFLVPDSFGHTNVNLAFFGQTDKRGRKKGKKVDGTVCEIPNSRTKRQWASIVNPSPPTFVRHLRRDTCRIAPGLWSLHRLTLPLLASLLYPLSFYLSCLIICASVSLLQSHKKLEREFTSSIAQHSQGAQQQ